MAYTFRLKHKSTPVTKFKFRFERRNRLFRRFFPRSSSSIVQVYLSPLNEPTYFKYLFVYSNAYLFFFLLNNFKKNKGHASIKMVVERTL